MLYIIFRAMDVWHVRPQAAIVINYFTCAFIGFFFIPGPLPEYLALLSAEQIWMAVIMGFSFVIVFNLLSRATVLLGVAASSVTSRISMIIPAAFAIIFLGESLTGLKITGMALAFPAIYLTVFSGNKTGETKGSFSKHALITLLAFLGTGLVDVLISITSRSYGAAGNDYSYIAISFFTAFAGGLAAFIAQRKSPGEFLSLKTLGFGVILGSFNYASLYLFVIALTNSGLDGSVIFPLNSIGIVTFSTMLSMLIFKEKLSPGKLGGLVLAGLAILLLALGQE